MSSAKLENFFYKARRIVRQLTLLLLVPIVVILFAKKPDPARAGVLYGVGYRSYNSVAHGPIVVSFGSGGYRGYSAFSTTAAQATNPRIMQGGTSQFMGATGLVINPYEQVKVNYIRALQRYDSQLARQKYQADLQHFRKQARLAQLAKRKEMQRRARLEQQLKNASIYSASAADVEGTNSLNSGNRQRPPLIKRLRWAIFG